MNDDVERRLAALTPRGAPAELRARILDSVAEELATPEAPRARRRFPVGLATAAALFLAVGLNVAADRDAAARIDRAFGPRPISPRALAIARDVAEAAGPEAGRWVLDRLSAEPIRADPDPARHADETRRLAHELDRELREEPREAPHPQIPQVGRDRPGSLAGRVLLVERVVHPRHGPTA